MKLNHYNIDITEPEPFMNRVKLWHGLSRQAESWTGNTTWDERKLEIDCFLSIMQDIKRDKVVMIELGAGLGDWTLSLAGCVMNQIVPMQPKDYYCYAVEADVKHHQWLCQNIESQKLNAEALWGAMYSRIGSCKLNTAPDAGQSYDQSVSFINDGLRNFLWSMACMVLGRTSRVPMLTVDHLVDMRKIEHIDILQMDVQHAEYEVMRGAIHSLGKIDYLMISTHNKEHNAKINKLISSSHDLIVDLLPYCMGSLNGCKPVMMQDGLQIYKRRRQ